MQNQETNKYALEGEKCSAFLSSYSENELFPYVEQLNEIALGKSFVLRIFLEHLKSHTHSDPTQKDRFPSYIDVIQNAKRYAELFAGAANTLVLTMTSAESTRTNFETKFVLPASEKALPLRILSAAYIGQLVRVSGKVARAGHVRPLAKTVAYLCTVCGSETFQSIKSRAFTPLASCPSPQCRARTLLSTPVAQKASRLIVQPKASHFSAFQEVKLQENALEVPPGNVPRSISVFLVGGAVVRSCAPGDQVVVDGVWLPVQNTGFRALKQGLTASTYLEAMVVFNAKLQSAAVLGTSEQVVPVPLSTLVASFAPGIYGMTDVKTALLLMLVSGVSKTLADGSRLRGNINVLLVGDPGLAKSQFLRAAAALSPRGVYTTGRSSSGVGLTASVSRDKGSASAMLEGGALVMADNGVCCIDEFDKMEEEDRTAIHEVMEQQTVSVAKAGIIATLNARASVLAAANPVFGRYDRKRDVESNIDIDAALLSRFDLVFVLVDRKKKDADLAMGEHMCKSHMFDNKSAFKTPKKPKKEKMKSLLSATKLVLYLETAKQIQPVLGTDTHEFIVSTYIQMRQHSSLLRRKNFVATPRVLLSLIRLAQAFAKLRLSNEVSKKDVESAIKLMEESVRLSENEEEEETASVELVDEIREVVLDMFNKSEQLLLEEVTERLQNFGYSKKDIERAIRENIKSNVWMLDKDVLLLI